MINPLVSKMDLTVTAELLSAYDAISLDELNCASLQQRVEHKYLLSTDHLPMFFEKMRPFYRCLEIDNKRNFGYRTQYYDTPDLRLYHDHHNGYIKRIKVRARCYEDSGLCFFETKQKVSSSRTLKYRCPIDDINDVFCEDYYKHIHHAHLLNRLLVSQLKNLFTRTTLCNASITERVTIDTNISVSNLVSSHFFNNMVIVEVKQLRYDHASIASRLLKSMQAKAVPFSKYIIGKALLHPQLKQNNFKPLILLLKKQEYA